MSSESNAVARLNGVMSAWSHDPCATYAFPRARRRAMQEALRGADAQPFGIRPPAQPAPAPIGAPLRRVYSFVGKDAARRAAPLAADPGDKDRAGPTVARALEHMRIVGSFFASVYRHSPVYHLPPCGTACDAAVKYPGNNEAFWDPIVCMVQFAPASQNDCMSAAVDVVGHELTHGLIQHHNPHIILRGQTRAIVEHACDVQGVLARQWWDAQQGVVRPDPWGLGSDVFGDHGVRSMSSGRFRMGDVDELIYGPRDKASPATVRAWKAYVRGLRRWRPPRDYREQYTDAAFTLWDSYVAYSLAGALNRVFVTATERMEGPIWDRLGQAWFEAVTKGVEPRRRRRRERPLPTTCDVRQFARVTIECTKRTRGLAAAKIVRAAWEETGAL